MASNRFTSLLGLAYRARRVVTGEEAVIQAVRDKTARVVLISSDASDRTKKTVHNKCKYYHVPVIEVLNRSQLGQAIGKQERVLIAVTDKGFGNKLIDLMDQ